MYLSGFAATHLLFWTLLGIMVVGVVLIVIFGSDRRSVVGFAIGAILLVVGFLGALPAGIDTSVQGHELRQAAKSTYGITLTVDQSEELVGGGSPWITLQQEGTRATEQKVHLIQVQDSERWKLVRVGKPRLKTVATRPELPRVNA